MKKKIAVRLDSKKFKMFDSERKLFEDANIEVVEIESDDPAEIIRASKDAEGLLVVSAKIKKEIIEELFNCKVISRYGTGVDNIDLEAATKKGIIVTNVPDFCIHEMAEHTIALLLAVARKLMKMHRIVEEGTWDRDVLIKSLRRVGEKQLGLIGFGNSARAVACIANSLKMKVVTFHRRLLSQAEYVRYNVKPVTLDVLLKESDFVSLHCPLTDETRHLIGERELKMMKQSSILINVARGGVVDEDMLAKALRENWIAGAGVDVFEHLNMFKMPEAPPVSPYFGLDNIIYTPHIAGTSLEADEECNSKAAADAIRVLQSKMPRNCANPSVKPWFSIKA